MTARDALNSALDEEMSADLKVFVMGEEVGEYQGAYKISKGLLEKYGAITEVGRNLVHMALISNCYNDFRASADQKIEESGRRPDANFSD
ncbi:Transketolase family protein [Perilla frutescens var. hirtella]|nr:Transketolase family protein [Perilla frutescens var. hirtella]KAH6811000.1 Transketolase family protein [Perilla frutescens var. frutescens]